MRIGIVICLLFSLLLTACSNSETSSENHKLSEDIQYVDGSLQAKSLDEVTAEADIIANIKIEEILGVIEREEHEGLVEEFTKYRAKINHYFYDNLNYGKEITIYQAGGPNWQFEDDPLLEVNNNYIVFLDERVDSILGKGLTFTGGPQGRYYEKDNSFIRQFSPIRDKEANKISDLDLIKKLNKNSSKKINIDIEEFTKKHKIKE